MGKKRRTRAQKERHAARLASKPAGEWFERSRAENDSAPRIGPQMRRRMKQLEDGTEVPVVEVLQFWVERRETTFGFKHPKLRFAMFGKERTNREGPFASWSEAREATVGDPGRIVREWSEPREIGRIEQAQGGMVALVAAGASAGVAAAAAAAGRARPELVILTDTPDDVAAALAPPPLPEKPE